ncbi:MAG: hypothetical protein ACYC4R_06045 [Anaerolineae bacterium]
MHTKGRLAPWKALIAANALCNGVLGWLLFGPAWGGTAVLLTTSAVLRPLARRRMYQRVLAWGSWLLPMAWPIQAAGVVALAFSAFGHLFGWALPQALGHVSGCRILPHPRARLQRIGLDRATGMVHAVGGLVANANPWHTAFNLGGWTFVDDAWQAHTQGDWQRLLDHETGHLLNLAAFGWIFHLWGWLDELRRRRQASAERLADSRLSPAPQDSLRLWS